MFFKLLLLLSITTFSCTTSGWEDIESDYDHVLNVIGIINLDQIRDATSESFVGVYRTTNLDEKSQVFVRADTLGYIGYDDSEKESEDGEVGYWNIDSIYVPAALIDNASVMIKKESGDSIKLSFVEFEYINFDTTLYDTTYLEFGGNIFTLIDTLRIDTTFSTRVNIYKDTTGQFIPLPNTTYTLSIDAPGYNIVTGALTTPGFPELKESLINDTISYNSEYEVSWEETQLLNGLLIEQVIIETDTNYFSTLEKWCYGYRQNVVELSENNYTVYPFYCDEVTEDLSPQKLLIRLVAMDENYYNYFISGSSEDYTNITVPNTTKGRSSGIDGGFGLFGSIASDAVLRIVIP